jgi:CHAT domain-containing protein
MAEAANGLPSLRAVATEVKVVAESVSRADPAAQVNIFLNREFTKRAFLSALATPRQYLHVASHYLLTGDGIGGGQLLVGDGSLMSAKEVWEALPDLKNVNLVTLSACDTGANLRNGGAEHIDGLSNVFLSRGADSVVGTLWSVADQATADFMRVFYDFYLAERLPVPDAMLATKKAFMDGGSPGKLPQDLRGDSELSNRIHGYRDPSYWAAFQIFSPNRSQATSKTVH